MPKTKTLPKSTRADGLIILNPEEASRGTDLDIYRPDDRDLRILMDRAVTEEDWMLIFIKAKEMALNGGQVGVKAMEFLAKYRFGLPAQMTRADGDKGTKITVVEVVRSQGSPQTKLVEEKPETNGDVPF